MIALLAVGLVMSADVSVSNKDVSIDKVDYDKLEKVSSTVFDVSPINCNDDECDTVYVKTGYANTDYKPLPFWVNCSLYTFDGTDCLKEVKIYFTDAELLDQRNKFVEDVKARIIQRVDLNTAKELQDVKDEKEGSEIITYTSKVAPKP